MTPCIESLQLDDAGTLPSEGKDGRSWKQFSKTKMCKFEVIGMCSKGLQCPFAHSKDELRQLPDLTCTKLCKTLIQTGVCDNRSCKYAHTKEELRATSTFHKTKLCRFSQLGHCALGFKCNFAHSLDEMRKVDEPIVDSSNNLDQDSQTFVQQELPQQATLTQRQLALHGQQVHARNGLAGAAPGHPQYLPHPALQGRAAPAPGVVGQEAIQPSGQSQRRRGGRRIRDRNAKRALAEHEKPAETLDNTDGPGATFENPGFNAGAAPANTAVTGSGQKNTGASGMSGIVVSGNPATNGSQYLDWVADTNSGRPLPTSSTAPLTPAHVSTGGASGLGDGPAYVTHMSSDFVVKNTFLEVGGLGAIGNSFYALRPIRSAAGRLDILGSEDHNDLGELLRGTGEGERLGAMRRPASMNQIHGMSAFHPLCADEADGTAPAGSCSVSSGLDADRVGEGTSSATGSTCHSQTSYNEQNGGGAPRKDMVGRGFSSPDSLGFESWEVFQKSEWQVKNTFLTLSPETKPIRSVRTAEGALCVLGDDQE